jgi:hypothetical protein
MENGVSLLRETKGSKKRHRKDDRGAMVAVKTSPSQGMKYATSLPVVGVDTALPLGDAACYIICDSGTGADLVCCGP